MRSFDLKERIFAIQTEEDFIRLSLDIYSFQREHCTVYASFVDLLGRREPEHYLEIPFLPISLFKDEAIITEGMDPELIFLSSGTTGMTRSRHLVADAGIYSTSFVRSYTQFIGAPKDQVILALLPNYIEQGNSSLVYMVDELIRMSDSALSGFVLDDPDSISDRYNKALSIGKNVVIFGVSYALLELADKNSRLDKAIIIETGGMKGRRKELTKEELHARIIAGTGVHSVRSEYGMTELLSQSYSDANGIFHSPPWMKILVRDVNDPFTYAQPERTGGINVIDLANLYSCSFISTQDLGRTEGSGFKVLGRFDQSELRGCNLMVD